LRSCQCTRGGTLATRTRQSERMGRPLRRLSRGPSRGLSTTILDVRSLR
jgi:hypothetical protein